MVPVLFLYDNLHWNKKGCFVFCLTYCTSTTAHAVSRRCHSLSAALAYGDEPFLLQPLTGRFTWARDRNNKPTHFYLLLYSMQESIGIEKIFDCRFLMDLLLLGCPEYDFTIFRKCLSVGLCSCVWHKFSGLARAKTKGRNCMKTCLAKSYYKLVLSRLWCISHKKLRDCLKFDFFNTVVEDKILCNCT